MALRYGYFDSEIIGVDDEGMPIFDRAETSELFALLFASLVSDGVLARPSTCFQVLGGVGLSVEVQPGFGMVKGHFAYNDEKMMLDIEPVPKKYSRIDRVVMRCNYLERMVEILIKTGTEAANPVPPELTRPAAGDYFELCLANIRLTAGQKVITQSSITDTRPDSSVCGYITQLIDHLDTSVFFAQFEEFYKEFVEKSDGSYDKFVDDMKKYLADLESSGDSKLQEVVDKMINFEEMSEQEWFDWLNSIKETLASVENGEMLVRVMELFNEMSKIGTKEDIDNIVNEIYIATEEVNGVLEIGTKRDIEDIVSGTYIEV